MKYYSQYCQDFFINILLLKKKGVFLDIGANDGLLFSNTYFFEKYKEWTGLCIEPHIDIFEKCAKNRSCFLENCCIASHEKTVIFRKITGADMLSGIVEFMSPASLQRIENHIKEHGGSYVDIEMHAYVLNELLKKYQLTHIDFCSIDVEGAEYDIIKSIDFSKYKFTSFAIEGNDIELTKFLNEKGYVALLSENDTFYIKKGTKRLYLLATLIKIYVFGCKVNRHLPKWLKRKKMKTF